jgi:hypothetical protein
MRISPHPQGSEGWLLDRCGIATASCFADVMATLRSGGEAAGRRNYRARLVVERLTGKPVRSFTTKSMEQGSEREPLARIAYEAETGISIEQVGLILHDEIEAGASPDGLHQRTGLEIKCPELATHLEYLRLAAEPPEYTWQIQGQMWIAELDEVDFVSFNPDFPEHLQLVIRRIKRDEQAIKRLAENVAKFMEEVKAETEAVRGLKVAA